MIRRWREQKYARPLMAKVRLHYTVADQWEWTITLNCPWLTDEKPHFWKTSRHTPPRSFPTPGLAEQDAIAEAQHLMFRARHEFEQNHERSVPFFVRERR